MSKIKAIYVVEYDSVSEALGASHEHKDQFNSYGALVSLVIVMPSPTDQIELVS